MKNKYTYDTDENHSEKDIWCEKQKKYPLKKTSIYPIFQM